jgi:ubiquinone/menaquinone biosynthesis C-methylase UbiE
MVGLRKGSTFVDIGCGKGFFTIPAAKLAGRNGKVYGVDVNAEAIDFLNKKANMAGLDNLTLKVGSAEETLLCEACADLVFFGIVLHDFDNVHEVLANARRMLKPSGLLADLDWKKEPMPFGPPLRIRFSEKDAVDIIEKADFKIESAKAIGQYNYLIVARRKTANSRTLSNRDMS